MNTVLTFIVAFGLGWWLGPAFTDIAIKVWHEIKLWRHYR
jgi:hypothetical protein